MQTFLPYADFQKSARVLDKRRLNKQVLEASQILSALAGKTQGWRNHPATRMWRGYEEALRHYYNVCWDVATKRGVQYKKLPRLPDEVSVEYPDWLYTTDICRTHRSNLLRKDREFYSVFGWNEPDNLDYIWPV